MRRFDPKALAEWTQGCWHEGRLPEPSSGFCFDTRSLSSGDLFVALRGARDGHDFVADAVEAGAVGALVERPLNLSVPQLIVSDTLIAMERIAGAIRAQFTGPVVGVTGSCGKTSTKEMLRLLMGEETTHVTAGNWNNRIGVPMTLFGLSSQSGAAVVEAGINQPGEMAHLGAMIQADLVVVTTIGPAHLELLGSLETIAEEKAQLLVKARPEASLILPNDAFHYPAFQAAAERAIVLAEEGETVVGAPAEIVRYTLDGNQLHLGGESYQIGSASEGVCRNAALALTVAERLGVTSADRKARMERWSPSGDRGRLLRGQDCFVYVDCYNANPASMTDALRAFDRVAPSDERRCFVLGAMNELGEQSKALHADSVAAIPLRAGDQVYLIGPEQLTDAYRAGLPKGEWTVESAPTIEPFKSLVAQFKGALFLKGSRAYALEQLIPETLKPLPEC